MMKTVLYFLNELTRKIKIIKKNICNSHVGERLDDLKKIPVIVIEILNKMIIIKLYTDTVPSNHHNT